MTDQILFAFAVLLFGLAAFNVGPPRVNLVWLAVACLVATQIV